MAGVGGIAGRLYRGEVSVNFVGRKRTWYTMSGIIVLVSAIALLVRKLNFSVDFKGGSVFAFQAPATISATKMDSVVTAVDPEGPAAEHGLQTGDVILDVGGKAVGNFG